VEACTSLANPDWLTLATNTLTDGWSYFSDPDWTNYPQPILSRPIPVEKCWIGKPRLAHLPPRTSLPLLPPIGVPFAKLADRHRNVQQNWIMPARFQQTEMRGISKRVSNWFHLISFSTVKRVLYASFKCRVEGTVSATWMKYCLPSWPAALSLQSSLPAFAQPGHCARWLIGLVVLSLVVLGNLQDRAPVRQDAAQKQDRRKSTT
jgi:hypothetical protein